MNMPYGFHIHYILWLLVMEFHLPEMKSQDGSEFAHKGRKFRESEFFSQNLLSRRKRGVSFKKLMPQTMGIFPASESMAYANYSVNGLRTSPDSTKSSYVLSPDLSPQSSPQRLRTNPSTPVLIGRSVHLECFPNIHDRQELPCIISPFLLNYSVHLYNTDEDTDSLHFWNKLKNQDPGKSTPFEVTFREGSYAYLPCRTLGAGEEETTIWEKADNPLFAATVRFTKDTRFHLVHNQSARYSGIAEKQSGVYPVSELRSLGLNKLMDGTNDYRQKTFAHSEVWDLVVDFLTTTDSDVYTCRLIGRTHQMIRYKLQVTKAKRSVIYSSERLVTITVPPVVQLGHYFNLTCTIQISQSNSAHIAIDWFRPEHSYQSVNHMNFDPADHPVQDAFSMSSTGLLSDYSANSNDSAIAAWLAQTFTQVTNRPAFGTTVFKQIRSAKDQTFRSDVVYLSRKATMFDEGLFECRAYEPANNGYERILDRAIVAVVVNKPYPYKPDDRAARLNRLAAELAKHWRILSGGLSSQHGQQIQNDGDERAKSRSSLVSGIRSQVQSLRIRSGRGRKSHHDDASEKNGVIHTVCRSLSKTYLFIYLLSQYSPLQRLWF